jgi:hypothetical protein
MVTFLQHVVLPTAHDSTILVLRRVLHDEPFKIRRPEELLSSARRLGDSVLTLLNASLLKLGMSPTNDTTKAEYAVFLKTQCGVCDDEDCSSSGDEASLPPSLLTAGDAEPAVCDAEDVDVSRPSKVQRVSVGPDSERVAVHLPVAVAATVA